ncbi:MAG: efflux transporter outer membrane subunit [Gemmatimonadetes bacterium]|nr:efflux transporter outer membrane subunit [Gemmatimonadota bacterium]
MPTWSGSWWLRRLTLLLGCAACTLSPAALKPVVLLPVPDSASVPDLTELLWSDIRRDSVAMAIVRTALTENRDLRIAMLRVEQARQQYRIRTGALLPAIDATSSIAWTEGGSREQTSLSGSVDLVSWEVDLFGRLRSERTQAAEQYLSSEATQRATRLSLITNAATQYYAVLRAESQRQLAERTLAVRLDLLELIRALVRVGQTSELDLRSSEAQVQQARITALTAAREAELARNALDVLVGQPVPRGTPSDSLFWTAALTPRALPRAIPSEMLLRRPDLARAEHDLLAAHADIGSARAAFFPRILLTGSTGSSSGSLQALFGAGTGVWSFVPRVSVPLFRGSQNRANLARTGRCPDHARQL